MPISKKTKKKSNKSTVLKKTVPITKPKKSNAKAKLVFYSSTLILILLTIVCGYLYNAKAISMPALVADSSITFSLFLTTIAFSIMLMQGYQFDQILQIFGLTKDKLSVKILAIGIILFLCILAFEVALSLFSYATNIQLPTNISTVLGGTPIYFLIFTFLVAPINEEIFFRGFLLNNVLIGIALLLVIILGAAFLFAMGTIPLTYFALIVAGLAILIAIGFKYHTSAWSVIVIGAVIFATAHLSYLSASEFAAAFVFGLLAGYVFKKVKSLYPSILAHMLVNVIAVTSLVYLGMLIHP